MALLKIFISWSGEESRQVAGVLKKLLPQMIQPIDVFVSDEDIDPGKRFEKTLAQELEDTYVGILCLNGGNLEAPWLLFEAGALAKETKHAIVIPYLRGVSKAELRYPLKQFQANYADDVGTWRMVKMIGRTLGYTENNAKYLRANFDRIWPEMEEALEGLPTSGGVIIRPGYFHLVNKEFGYALKATRKKDRDGGKIIEAVSLARNAGPGQRWIVRKLDDGSVVFLSAYTGLCMDVQGKDVSTEASVHQWKYAGGRNQKWDINMKSDGSIRLRCPDSKGFFLDLKDGKPMQIPGSSSQSQRWWLVPAMT